MNGERVHVFSTALLLAPIPALRAADVAIQDRGSKRGNLLRVALTWFSWTPVGRDRKDRHGADTARKESDDKSCVLQIDRRRNALVYR